MCQWVSVLAANRVSGRAASPSVTTIGGVARASAGSPEWMPDAFGGLLLLIAVTVGGYASAGAANAINMVIDRDIDALMTRTQGRPLVTGLITPVKELAELAHRRGLLISVDGAHPLGMMDLDLKAMNVHHYAAAGQKWLCGPVGSGMLWIDPRWSDRLPAPGPTYAIAGDTTRVITADLADPDGSEGDVCARLGPVAAIDVTEA